jgi:hypothetical protein
MGRGKFSWGYSGEIEVVEGCEAILSPLEVKRKATLIAPC